MKAFLAAVLTGALTTVFVANAPGDEKGAKKVDGRVFELRTYYAAPGKMDALNASFKDHTLKLFL